MQVNRIWTIDKIMRLLGVVLGAVALLWLVNYLKGVLFPFFAAFLLAYILDPLVAKLQVKVKHRIIAVIIVLLCTLSVVGGLLWFIVPKIVGEIQHLGVLVSRIFSDSNWANRLSEFVPDELWNSLKNDVSWKNISTTLKELDIWQSAQSLAGKVLPGAWGVISKGGQIFVWISGASLIFMYLVFIMLDLPKLRKGVRDLFPKRFKGRISEFGSEVDKFMGNYFRAQSLVALSVGVLYAIGFAIIGLPMGVAFGLVSGAMNMIPYFQLASIPVALLLAVVYALESGMPFWEVAIIVLLVYLIVQVIQDFFLVPKIVGSSMDLPPVGILLSLSIWGKLLGFLGLIVAIPFTCICLVYIKKIQQKADSSAVPAVEDGSKA
ncbi:AI-2E family transporter [Fibrobacter sp. UWEL]|uniref:AI-2E family transporter n=1 Tax=Fibrobacter sp. UWEL TaxID=1896209 RepID=UPI0009150F48|nr:AI-2E family transporter [Fibrobacter sp. UWEL]SHK54549.1 Predicted PurR-regulated permease PerM [Fibrobacter sp. UWEL]